MTPIPESALPGALWALAHGRHSQPHDVLGQHLVPDGLRVRVMRPLAEACRVIAIQRRAAAGEAAVEEEVLHVHRDELARIAQLVDVRAAQYEAIVRLAPPALAGALIAAIVFLPESLTALRAALAGEIQRVSNLCHGALVSTVGLTIPAILVIGLLTDQTVVLAESPANLVLLGITLGLSLTTFASSRVTSIHGAAHLVIFAAYGITVFS